MHEEFLYQLQSSLDVCTLLSCNSVMLIMTKVKTLTQGLVLLISLPHENAFTTFSSQSRDREKYELDESSEGMTEFHYIWRIY